MYRFQWEGMEGAVVGEAINFREARATREIENVEARIEFLMALLAGPDAGRERTHVAEIIRLRDRIWRIEAGKACLPGRLRW